VHRPQDLAGGKQESSISATKKPLSWRRWKSLSQKGQRTGQRGSNSKSSFNKKYLFSKILQKQINNEQKPLYILHKKEVKANLLA